MFFVDINPHSIPVYSKNSVLLLDPDIAVAPVSCLPFPFFSSAFFFRQSASLCPYLEQ